MEARCSEHHQRVLGQLNAMRQDSELTDVVLEVEGRSFPCHRAILASCCPYFHTMFTGGYAEAKQGSSSISIQDVTEGAMATILDYAYTGCLKLDPGQVQAVMSAASMLPVDFVFRTAGNYIKEKLDISNCADVLMYADLMGNLDLQQESWRYMASRFTQVALQPSFLQLSLLQLQKLLRRDDIITETEDDIVQATLKWIEFDEEERLKHFPALCKFFRHSLLSPKCHLELESKSLSAQCKVTYNNSTTLRLGQTRTEIQIFLRREFNNREVRYATPCYDTFRGLRYTMSMPHNQDGFSVAVTNEDELYLAGGVKYSELIRTDIYDRQKTFFQYNHLLQTWEPKCEMISPRRRCGLVYLKGYIYAIGGDIKNQTVEKYDPNSDEWTSLAPIPHPMTSDPCTVTLDDSIYAIGNEGCYCYSTTENRWNEIADMLEPPTHPQAVTYQGCIYCVDCYKHMGIASETCVEMYCPTSGIWKSTGGNMSFAFHAATLIKCEESLYLLTAIFKEQIESTVYDVYLYQRDTDSWLKQEKTNKIHALALSLGPWLGHFCRTHCLVARMIPACLRKLKDKSAEDRPVMSLFHFWAQNDMDS